MSRRRRGITGALLEAGARLVTRTAEGVMNDPRGKEAFARAVGLAQRGRRGFEELQGRIMQAAGVPDRQDYQDLAKQLARIKRKARELSEKLEATDAPARSHEGPDSGTR